MRAILQRVSKSKVEVEGSAVGEIGVGWLVLLGIGQNDDDTDLDYIEDKICHLRGFPDADGKMNLSVVDIQGEVLVVSQFTLYADCRKGRRPSFTDAGAPDFSNQMYQKLVSRLKSRGLRIATGQFQANMQVSLVNSGPVTFILDSKKIL